MVKHTVAEQFPVPSLADNRAGWRASLHASRRPRNLGGKDRERRGGDGQRPPGYSAAVEAAFSKSETLRFFPRVLLTRLQAASIIKRYEAKRILIERGVCPDCALLLVSGEVCVEEEGSATTTVIYRPSTLLNPDVLFHPRPQAERITAKTLVEVASISRASWESLTTGQPDVLRRIEDQRIRLLIEQFCKHLPGDGLREILNADVTVLQERLFAPNQVIYREGDPADYAYLLVRGEVHLARSDEEIQRPVNVGECFGHRDSRQAEARTSGAVARTWTGCLALTWSALDAVRASVGSPGLPLAKPIGGSIEVPVSPRAHEESAARAEKRSWWIRAINAASRAGEPLILEEDHTQTAMACLRQIGWHYGYRLTDEALLEASRFDTHCPSASALFDWAEQVGFRVAYTEAPINAIVGRRKPCIIRCRYGYYMTLLPAALRGSTFKDIRLGIDVELGLSVYEPFGIAPLEPLGSGAVCVVSDSSGAARHIARLARQGKISEQSFVIARFSEHDFRPHTLTPERLRSIEATVYRQIAADITERLAVPREERLAAARMSMKHLSWQCAVEEYLLPALSDGTRAAHERRDTPVDPVHALRKRFRFPWPWNWR